MVEYGISFFIFVLPSAFAFVSAKHMNKMFHCQTDFIRRFVMEEERPQFINKKWDQPGLYCFRYINTCFFLLTHLPLHFLLAVFENYLYQNFNMFHVMCSWTLSSESEDGPLKRAQILPDVMEGIQGGFGFFLLIDLTLMLCFWLLHTYFAYFTFQDGLLPTTASVLMILAEFSRVFFLSYASSKYTDNAETVIGRLEDEMTPEHAKHDKQVLIRKLKRQSKISACGFFTVDRSLVTSFLATTFTYWVILVQFTQTANS